MVRVLKRDKRRVPKLPPPSARSGSRKSDAGPGPGYNRHLTFPAWVTSRVEATCDCAYTVRMTPVSVMTTNFELNWYVRNDATEGVDYDVEQIVKVADATWSQDFKLCENNQLGVNSSRYQPGPYAPAELYSFEYGATKEVGVCEQVINWYMSDLQRSDRT